MNGDSGSDAGGGPMWGKFFDSIGAAQDDDAQSVNSGSHAPGGGSTTLQTPKKPTHNRNDSFANSPIPEVMPGDSASAVGAAESDVGARGPASSTAPPASALVDDGTYVFKFKTPSGRTHRFQARNDLLDNLREIVVGKLASDPFFASAAASTAEDETPAITPGPEDFTLSYTDDDGDLVHMTNDSDVVDSVKVARSQKTDRVVLVLSGGKSWEAAIKAQAPPAPAPAPAAVLSPPSSSLPVLSEEEAETGAAVQGLSTPALDEKLSSPSVEPASEPALAPPAKVHAKEVPAAVPTSGELVAGIPKDLVLPASIGFLGIVIIGVFAISRMSSK